jgi:hypothetical protein
MQSSIDFECSAENLAVWNTSQQAGLQKLGQNQVQKVPYYNLNLLQKSGSAAPTNHFSESVLFLKSYSIKEAIYVDSAPAYLALLMAASTEDDVQLILGSSLKDKELI